MGDPRVEDYVRTINTLTRDTGLVIPSGVILKDERENALAEIIWDEDTREYYPRYIH